MFGNGSAFERFGLVVGLATCTAVAAMVVMGPTLRPTELASAPTPVERVAKYQPAAGDAGVQVRSARNEAMASASLDPTLVDHCPRCR
ncbi:MAG: hypothetical protein U1E52_01125 [Geminicoccaceae bacterium]